MDEVPMKAGLKAKEKIKQTYFWTIYGEDDEVALTWSQNRGTQHAKVQLIAFTGVCTTQLWLSSLHQCDNEPQ